MEVLGILFEINELFELTFDGNHMLLGQTALSGRSKLVRSQIPREQPKRKMALGHRNGVSNREQLRCRHNVQSDIILCWRIVRTIVSSNCRRITRNKCGNCDGSATLKKTWYVYMVGTLHKIEIYVTQYLQIIYTFWTYTRFE